MEYLLLIAVLPGAFLLKYIYDKDRLDKESKKLLTRLLIFGAIAAVPAFLWETVGEIPLDNLYYNSSMSDTAYYLLYYFLVVGIAEEVCKYLMMRFNTWKNPEFNCSFDGIVYAVYASLGFAILENILYVFENGIATGLVRAISAVPGHAFFGVFMGVFYGMAREAENNGDRPACIRYKVLAVAVPAFAHGLYDFSCDYVIVWLAVMAALYILGIRTVKRSSERDTYISSCGTASAFEISAVNEPADPWDIPEQSASQVPDVSAPRYCPHCGTLNDGKFCPVCGNEMPK